MLVTFCVYVSRRQQRNHPNEKQFDNDDCDVNVIMARGTTTVGITLGDSVFVAVLKQYCAC